MNLYNASLPIGIENHILFLTNTTTSDFSQNQMKANINRWLHRFSDEIMDAMEGWDFSGQTDQTIDLVADTQSYSVPTGILKIKRIEIDYNGDGVYYKAEPLDINDMGHGTDSTSLAGRFSTTSPYYDLRAGFIDFYPIPDTNVTNGVKIWCENEITELSADTDEPGIAEPFHIGLAYGAARDWFEREGNTKMVRAMDKNLKEVIRKMREFYSTRDLSAPWMMKSTLSSEDYE